MAHSLGALKPGPFGLGCAPLGNLYRAISDQDAFALLEAAWAAGVRWFDTAPHYGLGLSERRLGTFLRSKPRDEFMVSTKVGRLLVPASVDDGASNRDDAGFDVPAAFQRVWDFSATGVRRSIEESLDRLGLEHIDLALLHDPTGHLEQAATDAAPTLAELKSDGVIGMIGAGTSDIQALEFLVERSDLDAVMVAGRFTLLDQTAAQSLFPLCLDRGISVLNVGVFNSGILASEYPGDSARFDYAPADRPLLARARAIAQICRERGTTLPTAAVHFARSHPAVFSIAIGAGSAAEVQSDSALARSHVPADVWEDLADEGLIDEDIAAVLLEMT